MDIQIIKKLKLSAIALSVAIMSIMTACGDEEEQWSPFKSQASLDQTTLGYDETILTGKTQGSPSLNWTAVITEGSKWCSFSQSAQQISNAGKVGSTFKIYLSTNETTSSRRGEIQIKFTDNYSVTLNFTQYGNGDNAEYNRAWGEQPEYLEGENLVYKTYYTTLSGASDKVRNYSICYDIKKLVAQWVAYPVHSIYMNQRNYEVGGSTAGRTNAWAFDDAVTEYKESSNYNTAYTILRYDYTDPVIPQSQQQNIVKGSYTDADRSLQRGHMLPSASRYNTWNTNAQTFYATNMMPQNGTLNGDSWGTVETGTRAQVCSDTLYVVVGTLYENARTITSRNRTITVPSHCYKLLLRTKKGNTGKAISDITSAEDLKCIGFLFENSSDGNISPSAAVVSVAEIEERSGFTFFRNIDPAIADEVKSQKNLSDWGSAFN